jgi:hypothetical protein
LELLLFIDGFDCQIHTVKLIASNGTAEVCPDGRGGGLCEAIARCRFIFVKDLQIGRNDSVFILKLAQRTCTKGWKLIKRQAMTTSGQVDGWMGGLTGGLAG